MENPLGLDASRPRLNWQLKSDQRAVKQTAYQILVASSQAVLEENRGDLWDTGKISSDETAQIYYAGKPLGPRQQCFWKVRAWDNQGNTSQSDAARWEMGLLQASDWQAKWIARTADSNIAAAPLLRRVFTLDDNIRQARAYVSGLGYFEMSINGQRVGDHWLDPGYTRYDRRVLYLVHDVTGLLKRGDNVVLSSGVLGKVVRVEEKEVGVEIATGVTVKVRKSMISEVSARGEPAAANDSKN